MKLDGQLTIGKMNTYDDLGLVLLRESELCPPEPKTYAIDIPGGNGVLDLTEAVGEIAYANRRQSFEFDSFGDFEAAKTRVSGLLHGRVYDYRIPSDPDYTYHGRFTVESYEKARHGKGRIKLSVSADPYKLKDTCTYRVNAAGGIVITLDSGRMPVCPTFEFASETIVAAGDISAKMQPGSYKVNDLWLHAGSNELYLNSYLGNGNVAIESHQSETIATHARERISDLLWSGVRGAAVAVEDWLLDTIGMHAESRIVDAEYAVSGADEKYAVYISYPWKDL